MLDTHTIEQGADCPTCRGPLRPMGQLGNLMHYRCRNCGMDCSSEVPDGADGDAPSIEQIVQWHREGGCEATDGCWVEPDGTCEHGKDSWMIVMGVI